jgi:hypothetical protein
MDAARDLDAAMWGKLLPELSMCLAVILLAVAPTSWLTPQPEAIYVALVAEGASLMFFCTLVDIATRVRKRPPWWVIVLIVGGVFLMYPEMIDMLVMVFEFGLWIFLPLAWSLFERIRELWSLPGAPDAEKIRRRTLTFDRLWVGIVIVGATVLVAIGLVLASEEGMGVLAEPVLPIIVALAFYGVAAFNAWRVHQPAFTRKPTSLVPWLDRGDGTYLSPL